MLMKKGMGMKLEAMLSILLCMFVSLGAVAVQDGDNEQNQNLSADRLQTARNNRYRAYGVDISFHLDSLCGLTFFQKHKGKLFASPVKDSLGFLFPAKQQTSGGIVYLEKVRLKRPFRMFKDAILSYNSEYELITIELSCVMPRETTQEVAVNELISSVAVMEQKYNVRFKNLDYDSCGSKSSLKLKDAYGRSCARREILGENVFIIAQCDKWVKTPKPLYQGHRPKSSEYFVLTIKAMAHKKKIVGPTKPKQVDMTGIDAL